ncbi:G-protein coupled receptor 84-like [Branchiostoma floridae]|uniref:G-protein coupled receptor 84-like n=1 Tax=Branchiostoma floridae TaxID=7739 RepID=A0A9J7N8G1_BRAFL|nr:G-protein coupled receptor 84-like [Branchiostoma floridae]
MISTWVYFVVFVLAIIITVTLIGCLLTIIAIWTRPVLRKLVNVPLASLSCADILYSIIGPALWIPVFLHPQWEPPGALCWLQGYLNPVLWGVSVSHMMCIALQRYFIVCTNSTRLKSKRVLFGMLFLTWLVSIIAYLPLHVMEEVKLDPKFKRCSLGATPNILGKFIPMFITVIIPYITALTCYVLIYNHVRKSKKRVKANAVNPSNRLAVSYSRGEGGSAGPSTKTVSANEANSSKDLDGGVWMGVCDSSSRDVNNQKPTQQPKIDSEPGKTKRIMVAEMSDQAGSNEKQQHSQDKDSSPSDEKQKNDDDDEPGKPKGGLQVATLAGPACPRVPQNQGNASQNSSAERQITKMTLILFAVYTACCMPMTIMVLFSSQVPSEAFLVGQVLMALNGALNPIVYGLMNKNIRQGYKHIWNKIVSFITRQTR